MPCVQNRFAEPAISNATSTWSEAHETIRNNLHNTKGPRIDQEELFFLLAAGKFRNVVVLTGVGVSTAAGIPDFRSPSGGLFETLRGLFAKRFPVVHDSPEFILSRVFVKSHPTVWKEEVQPILELYQTEMHNKYEPTATHRFCAWLHRRG